MIAKSGAAYHLEFNIYVWFVNFDLLKAFDCVDHSLTHSSLAPDGALTDDTNRTTSKANTQLETSAQI